MPTEKLQYFGHFEPFSSFLPGYHFLGYILVTEFLYGCLLLVTVVDIFVEFFLVVCYEMNFFSVLADLKWDFDQYFSALIING